jgi:hypothetical protein
MTSDSRAFPTQKKAPETDIADFLPNGKKNTHVARRFAN